MAEVGEEPFMRDSNAAESSSSKRVLVTGATGLVGTRLCQRLFEEGYDLVVLSRSPEKTAPRFAVPAKFLRWEPESASTGGGSLAETLREFERAVGPISAVVHLAGESVAGGRWNEERKRRIRDSRVEGTRLLLEALASLRSQPKTLVSASAIGFYGDRCEAELTEESSAGAGFLSEVCQQWEAAFFDERTLSGAGTRRVAIRVGVVLALPGSGGALDRMVPVFRMGLGGPVGSGRQYLSWIHLDDLVSLFVTALRDERYRGVFNGTAPGPTANAEFSRVLAESINKPCLLKAPAAALKLGLGEMSTVVLGGARVLPRRALDLGFSFAYPRLEEALRSLLRPDAEVFEAAQWIARPVEEVFSFFSAADNLERITPPWLNFRIVGMSTPEIARGTLIDYRLKLHGVPLRWRTLIDVWQPNSEFVDTQLRGPYSLWRHTHRFRPLRGGTIMEDQVLYRLPLGAAGRLVAGPKVRSDVGGIFDFRRQAIASIYGRIDS
jgi:hypothetical protein